MEKRKLLMVLSLMVAANSYGTLYPNKDKQTTEVNQGMLIEKDLSSNTVISVKDENIVKILADVKVNGENINSETLKKIININTDNKEKSLNDGELTYSNKGGKGVEIISIQKGNFSNNGEINIDGDKGIGVNITGAEIKVENNGVISATNKAVGVGIKNDTSSFTNGKDGIIKSDGNNSYGIKLDKGKVENNGEIIAINSGIGVKISNGKFINNGIIKASGINTDGVRIEKGQFITSKDSEIIVTSNEKLTSGKSEASGVRVNGNSKFENNGIIRVTGTNDARYSGYQGKGININDQNASAENKGKIIVAQNGIGVSTKGKFVNSNEIQVDNGGIGVNIIDNGNAENNGNITANNSSYGIKVSAKGSFDNKGQIDVNNGSIGIQASGGRKIVNNGKINLSNGSIGMKLEANSKSENIGLIEGQGKGVTIKDSLFVNSGEINASKIAIESLGNSTVYLKNGSKINGTIKGDKNINILALEGKGNGNGSYSNLDIDNYEGIIVKNGDVDISNSSVFLEYNKGTKKYLESSKKELEENDVSKANDRLANGGSLTLNNSELIIDFKDSLTKPENSENPIIDVGENGKLAFSGDTSFVFNSSDGRTQFNINEVLGVKDIDTANMKLNTTAIWNYSTENGNIIARRQNYSEVINKSQLNNFVSALDGARSKVSPEFFNGLAQIELLKTNDDFTQAMAQLSGGLHGYTVDMAAINARTLVNTMKNRALNSNYNTIRPINSWTQEIIYLDNNQRLDGLMSGRYLEKGGLGISEKQIDKKAVLGFVYGGSRGKAEFDSGRSGKITANNFYLGGYYKYDFTERFALNTNLNFIYSHNNVKRNVKFGTVDYTFESTYPTYTLGIGTSAIYKVADTKNNKVSIYAGIDANRIIQGNINENAEKKAAPPFAVKNIPVNEQAYFSLTPSAGILLQNTGYLFDRRYLVGADFSWETELGNVKDGKRIKLNENVGTLGIGYTVGTMKRENVLSTSLFGQIDLTESLSVNGRYTSAISDEYKADMVSLGLGYKMDSLSEGLVSKPLMSMLENRKPAFDRFRGTFAFMIEAEDNSDRSYYNTKGDLISGDYTTSTLIKPKFTLSLNDIKTKWSYYFEGYYVSNDLFKETRGGERKDEARRIHLEARWSDTYSKGNYGINIGYRNEASDKPALSDKPQPTRVERAVNQLRLTPNFTYEIGKGFSLNLKSTGVIEDNYDGLRKGQTDYLLENEFTLIYKGFMPRWLLKVAYFREDKWFDHSNRKLNWDTKTKKTTLINGPERYHSAQIRPAVTYYFENGDNLAVGLRIPIENGAWYNEIGTGTKASESYEMRYSVDYTHVVVPGFNVFGGITILDLKSKSTSGTNYGKVTRTYSFRPKLGFSYSF